MVIVYLLLVVVLLFLLREFALRPAVPAMSLKAPFYGRNYAHRGLHTPDKKVPENSLAAFRRAVDAGYGVELDIQLSQDGQVVVFHDDTLDRVCQVKGRVDAFTLKQLKSFSLCGTTERIPLLTEVFEVMDGKAPMIIELKTGPRNRELCEKALRLMRSYPGKFCIESFDPRIVRWFWKNAPDILRGQLAALPESYTGEPKIGRFILGHVLSNFWCRPQFIAYDNVKKPLSVRAAEARGALRVVWTARDLSDAKRLEQENDMVIFEFYTPAVQYKNL